MFADRADAARRLAGQMADLKLHDPIVLAIPRGGVVTGAVLARALGADLDVVLSRKLRAPFQPELALGAISEDGAVYVNRKVASALGVDADYLHQEEQRQLREIAERRKLYRAGAKCAPVKGRSVIVVDDGIATGSTMIAALHVVNAFHPYEVIVAAPVAPAECLDALKLHCDRIVCLEAPRNFRSVGQFYRYFEPVEDEDVAILLREVQMQKSAPAPDRGSSIQSHK